MPYKRVIVSKFSLKNLLIIAPLSFSGIYLGAQLLGSMTSSRNANDNAATEQTNIVSSSQSVAGVDGSSQSSDPGLVVVNGQGLGNATSDQVNSASGSSGTSSRSSMRVGNPLSGTPNPPPPGELNPGDPFSGGTGNPVGGGAPSGGGGGGGTGGAVPVDGGLSLLAAAGLAYGARKAYRRKKG